MGGGTGSGAFPELPSLGIGHVLLPIVMAMLPLPIVFIARHFNLMSDGSNKLSVSYRKSMMKDISNLEEVDETHFILGKNPRETPLPKPLSQVNLVPPGTKPLENSNSSSANSCYRTGYQNTIIPITPTTTVTPTVPESDS